MSDLIFCNVYHPQNQYQSQSRIFDLPSYKHICVCVRIYFIKWVSHTHTHTHVHRMPCRTKQTFIFFLRYSFCGLSPARIWRKVFVDVCGQISLIIPETISVFLCPSVSLSVCLSYVVCLTACLSASACLSSNVCLPLCQCLPAPLQVSTCLSGTVQLPAYNGLPACLPTILLCVHLTFSPSQRNSPNSKLTWSMITLLSVQPVPRPGVRTLYKYTSN